MGNDINCLLSGNNSQENDDKYNSISSHVYEVKKEPKTEPKKETKLEVKKEPYKKYKILKLNEFNLKNNYGNVDDIQYIKSIKSLFLLVDKSIICYTFPDYINDKHIVRHLRYETIDSFTYLEKANIIATFYWKKGTTIYSIINNTLILKELIDICFIKIIEIDSNRFIALKYNEGCSMYQCFNQKYEKINIFKYKNFNSMDINPSKNKLILNLNDGDHIFILDVKKFQLIFLISNKNIYKDSLMYFLNDINFIIINSSFRFNIFSVMEYKPLISYSKYFDEMYQKHYYKNTIFEKIGDNKFIISNFELMKIFQYKNNTIIEIGNFPLRIYSLRILNDNLYIGEDNCVNIYKLEIDKQIYYNYTYI